MSAQAGWAPPRPRNGRTPMRTRSSLVRMYLIRAADLRSGSIAGLLDSH